MRLIWLPTRLRLALIPVVLLAACVHSNQPQPSFRQDLRPFGFITEAQDRIISSFSDVSFLSNDLVLVTVNTKTYAAVEPLFSDRPPSKLLLFNLSQKALVKTAEMPIEKAAGSVKGIADARLFC